MIKPTSFEVGGRGGELKPSLPFHYCCIMKFPENRCEEETDCDVFANSQWDGVSCWREVCPQRPCCKELHVSLQSQLTHSIVPQQATCMLSLLHITYKLIIVPL